MAKEKFSDIIKKGHFKDYDKYYHSDKSYGTGESDTEGDASGRRANKKFVDSVQKHLWKNAKVDKDGNYIISKKSWEAFYQTIKKDIEKHGAASGKEDSPQEKE